MVRGLLHHVFGFELFSFLADDTPLFVFRDSVLTVFWLKKIKTACVCARAHADHQGSDRTCPHRYQFINHHHTNTNHRTPPPPQPTRIQTTTANTTIKSNTTKTSLMTSGTSITNTTTSSASIGFLFFLALLCSSCPHLHP